MVHFPSSFVYLNEFSTPMEVFFPWHILMDLPQVAPAFVGHLANPLGLDTVEFQPDVDSWCLPRVTETWENQVMLFQLPRKQNRIITIPFFFGEKKRWSSQTPKNEAFEEPRTLVGSCWYICKCFIWDFKILLGEKVSLYPRLSACSTLLQFCSSTCNLP